MTGIAPMPLLTSELDRPNVNFQAISALNSSYAAQSTVGVTVPAD
jgi:hypothetical protein